MHDFGKLISLLTLLFLLFPTAADAQANIFDESRRLNVDVTRNGPGFLNFRFAQPINGIYGLQDGVYTTTIEGTSILKVPSQNIGQVIVYARLISSRDTSIFMDNPNLMGSITITPVSDNRPLEQAQAVYDFNGKDSYRQIYYITQIDNVNEISIQFQSEAGFFIVSRVEVIPYTQYGVTSIRNRKDYDNRLNSLPTRYNQLRASYTEELQRIEDYHKVLNELINREESANLARLKTKGFNPFSSQEFTAYYNQLLDKASAAEKVSLNRIRDDISKFNFKDIALTVDNLLLGGKFSTLVSLVGNVFQNGISLTDDRGRIQDIIQLSGINYFRDDRGSKVKLDRIDDPATLNKVNQLTEKNQQFQQYIEILQELMGQDLDVQNRINQDIQLAKSLREDLERLEWEILSDFTDRPRSDFIADNIVNYTMAYAEFNNRFPALPAADLNFLDRQELRLQSARNNLKDIRKDYQRLLGNLKTHYDNLYANYPQDRIGIFQPLNLLPVSLGQTWNENQREIIKAYQESALLKRLSMALSSL